MSGAFATAALHNRRLPYAEHCGSADPWMTRAGLTRCSDTQTRQVRHSSADHRGLAMSSGPRSLDLVKLAGAEPHSSCQCYKETN